VPGPPDKDASGTWRLIPDICLRSTPMRVNSLLPVVLFAGLALTAFAQSQPPKAAAGALLYIGTWPKNVLVIDEAQGKVVDRITLHTGTPQGLTLSYDKKKIYATTWQNGIEVIDLATRQVTNYFILNEGNRSVRLSGLAPDPQDQVLYATIRVAIKQVDRFEIEKPKFAVIDLAQKKITKTFDFPKEHDSPFGFMAGYRVSPDGKLLYVFKEDVLIFDLKDFKQVDKIELSKPPHPGAFPIRIGGGDDPNEEPGVVTSVFNATDPVVRRRIFGIARLDLQTRNLDFTPVGPATTGMTGLHLTPDRKTGYTVAFMGGGANRRTEFWVFDIPTRKLIKKLEFESRTRFSFALSGDGRQLYIYGAGPTIELYDANTLKLQRIINFDGDSTTGLLVLRPRP
jgi:DNA-binding beta-propeller fold protein YncE